MGKGSICPNCGFIITQEGDTFDYGPRIQELLWKRSKAVKGNLWKTLQEMLRTTKPTARDIFFFLKEIEEVEDEIVNYSINQFYSNNLFVDKPLGYLRQMILNFQKDKDKLLQEEKRKYGTKPPKRNK